MENTKIHEIDNIYFTEDKINLIVDSKEYSINIQSLSQKLLNADERQRNNFELSPSGYGIYWPEIDEDLSIDGIIGQKNKIERQPSLKHRKAV